MKKYTYIQKSTGNRVQTNYPINDDDHVLLTHIRDGQMNRHKIYKK